MQRLFAGSVLFLLLSGLLGCAALKQDRAGTIQPDDSVPNQSTSSPASDTAQTCRIDGQCVQPQVTFAASLVAPAKSVPVVQLPETTFDFGTMSKNKDYVHKFKIKNVGTADLIIEKIIPG